MTTLAFISLFAWFAILLTGAWRLRECLEADPNAPARCGDVTALIPARNEADVIVGCLEAVRSQVGHVVVVDDRSGDETASLVNATDGVDLVVGEPRPGDWSGKLWALQQGLAAVKTPWVLLLDADVRIQPHLVGTLRRRATDSGLAMISLLVELPMRTLVERWLMPPFVYFFRLIYPFARANDATAHQAAAAGGCVLVRRDALMRVGAFASLHDAIIDDCSLAAAIKRGGYNLWIGLTRSARCLRGYGGLSGISQMVARTAFTQLRYSAALLTFCTVAMLVAFVVPIVALTPGPAPQRIAGAGALTLMVVSYLPLLRYYGLSAVWAALLPAAALAYLFMTWLSALRYWRGIRSQWKQRTYRRDDSQRGAAN